MLLKKSTVQKALQIAGLMLFAVSLSRAQTSIPAEVGAIFKRNCATAKCHVGPKAPRGLDLSRDPAAALIGVPSAVKDEFLLVKPGDPANSYLIKKLLGAPEISGDRMPKEKDPLPREEIRRIARWIRSLPPDTKPVARPRKRRPAIFPGWTLANLPTPETPLSGGFVYRISHRFRAPVKDGFARFFGLDGGAFMLTEFGVPLSNDLAVTLGRSAINATFELTAKYRLLRRRPAKGTPLAAALHVGAEWATFKQISDPADPSGVTLLDRTDGERFSFFAQIPVAGEIGGRLGLLVVPGILVNGNVTLTDEDPLITLGLGAKYAFSRRYGVFVEWVPILSGEEGAFVVGGPRFENGKRVFNDTFSAGIEIHVGGHVFHVFVSNSGGNTTNQYMSGGNFDFADGDFRLGFNIYRMLNYPF